MSEIFVALSTFAEYGEAPLKLLEESGFTFHLNSLGRRLVEEEIIEMGKDSTGIIAGVEPYDDYVLDQLKNLRCISRCGVGIDNISIKRAKSKGITIRNTPDVVIQPVVELTIAMIFDLLRKLSFHTALMKSNRWEKHAGNLLSGKKVGILGLGGIGKRVAEVMLKLGTEVYGTDIHPDVQWADKSGVKLVSFAELLRVSDILSIHLSEVKDKPLKIGKAEMRSMKHGAIIINVARGQFLDELSLYNCLKDKHLNGAGLDVFPEEPYRGMLCELDNVVLTPHLATLTKESRLQMELVATKNLIEVLKA